MGADFLKGSVRRWDLGALPYFIAGLVVLAGTVALYFGHGGVSPHTSADWANFGTYLGGIAGPLLSFVALIAVVRTMHLQRAALELEQARQIADQHLRWLDAIYKDILEARSARVSPDITLGEILDGDADASQVEQKRFAARLENLMQLVVQYCQAVNLYRDNISEFFDLRIYTDRGGRLLDSIKPFHGYLGSRFLPTFEFCDMHLRGEETRAEPEALRRSSRQS
jgi:hypothetical protein